MKNIYYYYYYNVNLNKEKCHTNRTSNNKRENKRTREENKQKTNGKKEHKKENHIYMRPKLKLIWNDSDTPYVGVMPHVVPNSFSVQACTEKELRQVFFLYKLCMFLECTNTDNICTIYSCVLIPLLLYLIPLLYQSPCTKHTIVF